MTDTIAGMLGGAGLPELALVATTLAVAGYVRGFIGFGASLIIVMVLSLILGPKAAVPIAGLSGLPSTVYLLPTAVRHSERAFVVPFGLACFAAAPFGTWVLVWADPALMRIAISLFVVGAALMLYRGWRLTRPPGAGLCLTAGSFAGLVQGAAGVGGPPAVAVALSRDVPPERQRANVIGAVTAIGLSGLPALWYHGLFTREVLAVSLIGVPLYVGATWLGDRLFAGRGRHHYRNAALLALALIGLITLALAARDYLGG